MEPVLFAIAIKYTNNNRNNLYPYAQDVHVGKNAQLQNNITMITPYLWGPYRQRHEWDAEIKYIYWENVCEYIYINKFSLGGFCGS